MIAVPDLPRGALGKVKRAELAEFAARHDPTRYAPPRDAEETLALRVFAEMLDRDDLGVDDNFFQRGGDSLSAARAVASIEAACGIELPVSALFRSPTAAGLAAHLRAAREPANATAAQSDVPIRRRMRRPLGTDATSEPPRE